MPRQPRARASGRSASAVFVDSGGWIALFSARDGHHAEADRLIRLAVERRVALVTTNLVLAEVHRLLLFRAGIKPAAAALDHMTRSPRLTIVFAGPEHHRSALEWLAKLGDQTITYTDAISFAAMQSADCTSALTFDHDFTVAGFTPWQ